ncbi:protein SHORTAGE IN CHIASMATA 1 isoform X2 [Jatropha curcas]|uniref:protein SHORTAGE IN CHIASMATA 1 isoform X2 n=1 Tax=Jatropha curcas TaxID=180498 RepID=UPI001893D44B|nr:protein SHORTAGE IN CHIASMATA 1 isoform X2 [Jatropha curcas]
MRTRFLNIDYFTSLQSPSETLSFLNLPIPRLPPSRLPNFEEHLFRFDPEPNISPKIGRLPIEAALSKFISEVTPQKIDVDYGGFEDHQPRNAEVCAGQQWRFSSGTNQVECSKAEAEAFYEDNEDRIQTAYGCEALEKDNERIVDEHIRRFEFIQFEIPELDEFPEQVCFSEEGMQILSEVPDIENDPNFLCPGPKVQCFDKVQESLYSVEHVTLEFDMDDKKACMLEDDDSGQEQMNFNNNSFPLLEVDDVSLRVFTNLSVEDELLTFLENINSKWDQKDNPLIDGIELLSSMQYDVLKFLSNHCILKQCIESELASMDTDLGMDIISLVENDSANCFFAISPLVFQEFEFLELDSSQIYGVFFNMQKTDEPVSYDCMYREDKKFKNFNELIASCELAMVDDTFKSMPVPILSDPDKIRSLHTIFEEILAELKPELLSASDGIYLDWHLLEKDKCSSKIFSFYQNVLEELDSHSIDLDLESFNKGKGLIDFVLLHDALDGPKVKEYEESLNMFPEDIMNDQLIGVASRESLDDRSLKSGIVEHPAIENAEKATLLFKSMSQFNDLDFFLNPGKATGGGKSESAVKAPVTNAISPKEGGYHSVLSVGENMDGKKLKEMRSFLPTERKHNAQTSEAAGKVEACCMPMAVPNISYAMKPEQTQGDMLSFPEIIIVVNTQTLDKEMIVSRRSTYQKILAMEKEGLQVVERDLNLPVDVVIMSSICLVWYDWKNIRMKATAVDEASSCLPLCIENIATNVLTLLSFTFSCCILVFEGDINFLSTVMETSDGIYAAAASLGVDLQLFCSYSSELTDEIILSNISYAAKLYKGIYPKMPESETLAESFLTNFPSVNPLTAHAILSSVGILIEFFEWPNKRRILAVHQYNVPEESITLFSASCSYGEREDSKSTMTDCSSSVSSGPDSNKCHFNTASEAKLPKCIHSPLKIDICVDDIWQPEPLNQFPDEVQGPSGVIEHDNSWMSRETAILDDLQWPGPSLKNLFGQKQGSDFAQAEDLSAISKPYDFKSSKDPVIFDEINNPRLYSDDKFLGQTEGSDMIKKNMLDRNTTSKSESLHQDLLGEVIDLTDSLGKGVPPITNYMDFSTWLPETEQDTTRKSKAARRLSFDKNGHPTLPTAAAINSGSDLWSSIPRQGKTKEVPFKEEISHYGGTSLSKAIHSAHPEPGSPWTIEFLNRIREKSRLRQQSLPCDMSTTEFGYSGNVSKVTKKRSPSILEFFKYKGSNNSGKIYEQKKQKQSKQLPSQSKSERTSSSFLPTGTPLEKRSRQTLSFEKNGSGSQTRLVWTDGSAHRLSKKLRNQ